MRKFVTTAALAVAVAGVAGCGGGGSQDSPTDTAKAFLAAVKTNNATNICKYIHVSNTSSGGCVDLLSQALAGGKFSGSASVGNAATSGNEALVVTVGTFSFAGQSLSNSDPNAGLPSNGESFAQAYAAAGDNPKSPDLTLQKFGDKWYVVMH